MQRIETADNTFSYFVGDKKVLEISPERTTITPTRKKFDPKKPFKIDNRDLIQTALDNFYGSAYLQITKIS